MQSHFGILASNAREESFGDKISQFLLGARIFCTESYNKDIGRENRHTWQKTSKFQVPGTQHSEYSQNHKQSETIILANGINRTKQTFCSVQLTLWPFTTLFLWHQASNYDKTTAQLPPFFEKVIDLCCVCLCPVDAWIWHSDFSSCIFTPVFIAMSRLLLIAMSHRLPQVQTLLACWLILYFVVILATRGLARNWLRHGDDNELALASDRLQRQESFLSSRCGIVMLQPTGCSLFDSFKAGEGKAMRCWDGSFVLLQSLTGLS